MTPEQIRAQFEESKKLSSELRTIFAQGAQDLGYIYAALDAIEPYWVQLAEENCGKDMPILTSGEAVVINVKETLKRVKESTRILQTDIRSVNHVMTSTVANTS
jgi:hypothetical protein